VVELGVISAATQAVARLLRLSKTARLAASVTRYAKLHEVLRSQEGLEEPAKKIGALIDFQVTHLVVREGTALTQVHEWGGLIAAIFCATIVASPIYWLWTRGHWWSLVLAVLLGAVAILFVIAGATTVKKSPETPDEQPSASLTAEDLEASAGGT
jgi:hypothetical protein